MIVMLAACAEKERPQTMVINDFEHPYNERLMELVDKTKGRSKSEITHLQLKGMPPQESPDYSIKLKTDNGIGKIRIWENNNSYKVDIQNQETELYTLIKSSEFNELRKLSFHIYSV